MSYSFLYDHESKLTGRARIRPQWTGKMILQVEWHVQAYIRCPKPYWHESAEVWREKCKRDAWTEWRDATWQDTQGAQLAFEGQPPRSSLAKMNDDITEILSTLERMNASVSVV